MANSFNIYDYKKISRALYKLDGLSPQAKDVLDYIASLNAQGKDFYASPRGLIGKERTSIKALRTAQKILKQLKDEEWIVESIKKTKDGRTIYELNIEVIDYTIVKKERTVQTHECVPTDTPKCVPTGTHNINSIDINSNTVIIKKRKSEEFKYANKTPKGITPDSLPYTTNHLIALKCIADIIKVKDEDFNKFIDTTEEYTDSCIKVAKEAVSAYNNMDKSVAEPDKYRTGIALLAWGLLYDNTLYHPLANIINLKNNFSTACLDGFRSKMIASGQKISEYDLRKVETFKFMAHNIEPMSYVKSKAYDNVHDAMVAYKNYTPKRKQK